ncbi:hypothetical protein BACT_0921 [Bifidobacterium actinocoloniiforme DSM 22766]|uniref:Uncharacterized protein n=1 Tax=Bifidobacterium actinocoloniiforme DSM 22766 TaxID=1437605 RepID=A0A086Z119_9BIFI|nr:hypothetical protein [Bifidobacterium actinocoloniiforme]AKV55395.1 hypothetical protein AB656_03215 [Bifidobacterium actinocoloniiforme DSM 22766]KFI40219.1 hypothetical protein BACT_0921 [Bifidobacterium actinocoloniiforme DSM 22766]
MQNLTLMHGGTVKRGMYGHIETGGRVFVEPGTHFQSMHVTGDLICANICGGTLVIDGSFQLPTGELKTGSLSGQGRILGEGSIRTARLDFKGLIRTEGDIVVKQTLKFTGLMEGQRWVAARQIDILGVVQAQTMLASNVTIRNMHPKVVPLEHVKWMVRASRVPMIICREANIHRCGCHLLQAYEAELREGSLVREAVCLTTLTMDQSSAAVLIQGGPKRKHVAGH